MQDGQPKIRMYAIEALVASAWVNQENAQNLKNAVPALLERFNDSDWKIRAAAASVLSAIYPRPPATISDSLIVLLDDPETKVVLAAMGSLTRLAPDVPGVADIILAMMDNPNSAVKKRAAQHS